MTKTGRILLIILAAAGACRPAQAQEFRVKSDHTVVFGGQHLLPDYLPEFTVLFSAADPQLRMRPADIPRRSVQRGYMAQRPPGPEPYGPQGRSVGRRLRR